MIRQNTSALNCPEPPQVRGRGKIRLLIDSWFSSDSLIVAKLFVKTAFNGVMKEIPKCVHFSGETNVWVFRVGFQREETL